MVIGLKSPDFNKAVSKLNLKLQYSGYSQRQIKFFVENIRDDILDFPVLPLCCNV